MILPEGPRSQVKRDIVFFDRGKIVIPEFVTDKDHGQGIGEGQEFFCVALRIEREIKNMIGPCVIFAHLVTGWREKSEQDPGRRFFFFYFFNDGPSLFELAQRSAMEPNQRLSLFYISR